MLIQQIIEGKETKVKLTIEQQWELFNRLKNMKTNKTIVNNVLKYALNMEKENLLTLFRKLYLLKEFKLEEDHPYYAEFIKKIREARAQVDFEKVSNEDVSVDYADFEELRIRNETETN